MVYFRNFISFLKYTMNTVDYSILDYSVSQKRRQKLKIQFTVKTLMEGKYFLHVTLHKNYVSTN